MATLVAPNFLKYHVKMKKTETAFQKASSLYYILLFILIGGIQQVKAQTVLYDSISKQKVALIDVRKTYERIIDKGYDSIEMFEYLGAYYYKDKDFQKSKLYFDMLFKKYKLSQISQKSIDLYKKL